MPVTLALAVALLTLAGRSSTALKSVASHLRGHGLLPEALANPTKPGCYVWTPLGCPQQKGFDATAWTLDAFGMLNFYAGLNRQLCERARKVHYQGWCRTPDIRMYFVPGSAVQTAWGAGMAGPRPHFATMGHGLGFEAAGKQLCSEANNASLWVRFSQVHCFTDVPQAILQTEKWGKHLQHAKGHGMWFWKPAIVQMILRSMPEDDVLFYADAATSLHDMPMWREWQNYFEKGADVFVAQTKFGEKGLTTGDVFKFFGVPFEGFEGNTGQFSASFIGFRNTARTRMLVDKWVDLVENITLLDDKNTTAPNCDCFALPMYDQSLFSMLLKAVDPESGVRAGLKTPGLRVKSVPFHYGDGSNNWAITAQGQAHVNAHALRGENVTVPL